MQFTICTTRKPMFHDPYESYELKDTIYDPYQFVYIRHGCLTVDKSVRPKQAVAYPSLET